MSFFCLQKNTKKENPQLTELRRAAAARTLRRSGTLRLLLRRSRPWVAGGEVVAPVASASATMVTPAPAVLLLEALAVEFLWRLERRRLREVEELMAEVRRRR